MANRRWLDELRRRLVAGGLPPGYVRRLAGELEDHLEDLFSEEPTMSKEALEARIGDTEAVAEAAVAEYHHRTFFGRHPVWTFLVAPLPTLLLGWAAFMLLCLALFKLAPMVLGAGFDVDGKPLAEWPAAMVTLAWVLYESARFVPPAIVALLFWRLASRGGLGWRWSLAACLLVALLAGAYTSQIVMPVEPGQGKLMVGLGVSMFPSGLQLLQLAVPALIGLLSAWRLASVGRAVRAA